MRMFARHDGRLLPLSLAPPKLSGVVLDFAESSGLESGE